MSTQQSLSFEPPAPAEPAPGLPTATIGGTPVAPALAVTAPPPAPAIDWQAVAQDWMEVAQFRQRLIAARLHKEESSS